MPTAPEAPPTSSVSSGPTGTVVTHDTAVRPATHSEPATSTGTFSGRRTSADDFASVRSAMLPGPLPATSSPTSIGVPSA